MEIMVNIEELERVLLLNWTRFINPQRMIAFVLSRVRDSDLNKVAGNPPMQKSGIQVSLSQFRPAKDGSYILWAEFLVPKEEGTAIGTCEMRLDLEGSLNHIQTVGSLFIHQKA